MPSRHRSRERALQMIYQWELSQASPDRVVETYWSELSEETSQAVAQQMNPRRQ